MKLICSKSSLLQGVNVVLKAVSNKTTLPILGCILLNASNGNITLTANDMELGIESIVDGEIQEAGTVALNAKLFSEIVRKLPDSDITICVDELNQLSVRTLNSQSLVNQGKTFHNYQWSNVNKVSRFLNSC